MSEKRCLVTGGTGFIGRHAVQALTDEGYEVTILARRFVNGFRTIVADLTVPEIDLGREWFPEVYHVAGLAHRVPHNAAEREMFFQVNVEGTRNLLQAMERAPRLPEVVVLISTVAVYGVEAGLMLDEATPRHAEEPYGASKLEAEDLLMAWGAEHGVRTPIVRLPLVAGCRCPGNLGAMARAMAQGRYLGVGSGDARRSIVLATDVSRVLPRIAQLDGVFHLTDGHHPSFAELEAALSSALRRREPRRLPVLWASVGARIGDALQPVAGHRVPLTSRTLTKMTSTLTFSDQRARELLHWAPGRVLDSVSELLI